MIHSIRNIFPRFVRVFQLSTPNYPVIAITIVALSAISLYLIYRTAKLIDPVVDIDPTVDPMTAKTIENLTEENRRNIQSKFYITKVLFYGPSGSGQEMIAKKMARDLSLKFHCFDGRNLADREYRLKTGWHSLFQRISAGNTPEFVFVSHADDVCRDRRINLGLSGWDSISTILGYTGSRSKTVLLCLGVSSLDHLDPAIYSSDGDGCRYQDLLYIPLPGLNERIGILHSHLSNIFGNTVDHPSQKQLARIAEKADGLSGKSLVQVLKDLYTQQAHASEWTEEMIAQSICNKMERQKICLPNLAERVRLIEKSNLGLSKILTLEKLQSIAEKTEGFSKHMLWSMLLDISEQTLPNHHDKYVLLTEDMVDRIIANWTKRTENISKGSPILLS